MGPGAAVLEQGLGVAPSAGGEPATPVADRQIPAAKALRSVKHGGVHAHGAEVVLEGFLATSGSIAQGNTSPFAVITAWRVSAAQSG